jgi:hypothetical protein
MNERDRSGRRDSKAPPKPANDDERLDEALKETFPASDPPSPTHPDITGWDLEDRDDTKRRKR